MPILAFAVLVVATVAAGAALVHPAFDRWASALAAALVCASLVAAGSLAAGAALLAGVAVATAVEAPGPTASPNFNSVLSRLLALAAGIAGALVGVVRLLSLDAGQNLSVLLLIVIGLWGLLSMLTHPGPPEEGRAARSLLAVAAAAWALGGHPAVVAAGVAAALMVLLAAAGRGVRAS